MSSLFDAPSNANPEEEDDVVGLHDLDAVLDLTRKAVGDKRMDAALAEAGGAYSPQVIRKLRKIFEVDLVADMTALFAGLTVSDQQKLWGEGRLFSAPQAERIFTRRNPKWGK